MITTADMILVYLLRGGNYAAAIMEEYDDDMDGADSLSETSVRRALSQLEERGLISRVMTERGWWVPVEDHNDRHRTLSGRPLRYSYLTQQGLARSRLIVKGLERAVAENEEDGATRLLAQSALADMRSALRKLTELETLASNGYLYGLTEEGARAARTARERLAAVLRDVVEDDEALVSAPESFV